MKNYLLSKVAGQTVELAVSVEMCKQDLKLHLQHTVDDELITDYIDAACALVGGKDGITGKVLTSEVWDLKIPCANGCVFLPLSPVIELVSIEYFDSANELQSLNIADFSLWSDEDSAVVEPKPDIVWPAVYARRDAIKIRFKAGFGGADQVPKNITRAIRLLVSNWYENRSAVVVGASVAELPFAVESLLGISRKGWSA